MIKKKSEQSIEPESSIQPESSHFSKSIPNRRIQTAEGWKRSQMKMRKSPSKSASKS